MKNVYIRLLLIYNEHFIFLNDKSKKTARYKYIIQKDSIIIDFCFEQYLNG